MTVQPSEEQPIAPDPIDQSTHRWIKLFAVTGVMILVAAIGVVLAYHSQIDRAFASPWFNDFSTMNVMDGFHKVSIPGGNNWTINYEADHEVIFEGLVLHNSPIREEGWEIMTQDILVTSGDFSDPRLVYAKVSDHHFVYRYKTEKVPIGTINLLHTLPVSEEIDEQLQQIKKGDHVIIRGWDIYNLTGWDNQGYAYGTWQDEGCNTTLVTEVVILPDK